MKCQLFPKILLCYFLYEKFVKKKKKGQKKSAETHREQLGGVNSLRRGEHIFYVDKTYYMQCFLVILFEI